MPIKTLINHQTDLLKVDSKHIARRDRIQTKAGIQIRAQSLEAR